jgi:hypothetical protein
MEPWQLMAFSVIAGERKGGDHDWKGMRCREEVGIHLDLDKQPGEFIERLNICAQRVGKRFPAINASVRRGPSMGPSLAREQELVSGSP